jgi:5-methylcytosine-specific restriction endonuclease McrA
LPRLIRDYKDEAKYHAQPEQKKNRAARNKARRQAIAEGTVKKGDSSRDVDHKTPLSKGGSNSKSNRQVLSASSNRSFKRNSKGGIK